jgi:hypothetical protein
MKYALLVTGLVCMAATATVSPELVATYLDSLGASYEQQDNAFLLYIEEEGQDPWAFAYIETSDADEACYMVAFTPGVLPESGEERVAGLETLARLNWEYTFVKFMADPDTGEISVMYTFSVENGMGFDAFAAMMYVLIGTVQENLDVLSDI